MTLNDFLKRVDIERDKDKMIIYKEGEGWTNIDLQVNELEITITGSTNSPFSDE